MSGGRHSHLFRLGMAAAVASAMLASGCRKPETGEVHALVIGERQPRLADPARTRLSAPDSVLVENAAQGLVRFDAAGNIAPGLAERWAVSDDGLSYVFRLRQAEWSDGRKVRARDVVRLIKRQLAGASRNRLRDTVGAVREVVAMTDRVIAIELSAPRPHLLQLLAQPEFGLLRDGQGTGPFAITRENGDLLLTRTLPGFDGDEETMERVRLAARPAGQAIADFLSGRVELVLGGTGADLPVPLGTKLPRGALRIDPVAGLFGLVPARDEGPAGEIEVRQLLDEAIDRQALVAAMGLPQLQPRTSLLQPGVDNVAVPFVPEWAAVPLEQRRTELVERAARLFPRGEREEGTAAAGQAADTRPRIRVAVPDGPGGAIILRRLQADWGVLGLDVQEAKEGEPADFRWIDEVAPSTSPAWFLRYFRCEYVAVCLESADQLLDAARVTVFAPQRSAFFAEAERQMREAVLFLPVAAPIRWSLTARDIAGFSENRFGRHPLTGLREPAGTQD